VREAGGSPNWSKRSNGSGKKMGDSNRAKKKPRRKPAFSDPSVARLLTLRAYLLSPGSVTDSNVLNEHSTRTGRLIEDSRD
jgi:hypothetical protein